MCICKRCTSEDTQKSNNIGYLQGKESQWLVGEGIIVCISLGTLSFETNDYYLLTSLEDRKENDVKGSMEEREEFWRGTLGRLLSMWATQLGPGR